MPWWLAGVRDQMLREFPQAGGVLRVERVRRYPARCFGREVGGQQLRLVAVLEVAATDAIELVRGGHEHRCCGALFTGLKAKRAGLLLALANLGPHPLEHVSAHVPAEVRLEYRARMHRVGRDAFGGPPPMCLDREQDVGRL